MGNDRKAKAEQGAEVSSDRRTFVSVAAMGAGLAASYGTLGAMAGRFLYPARPADKQWMFVAPLERLALNDSLVFRSPTGETINITRTASQGNAADIVALSSTCPHLGCQVHWEAQNERYFCPCHNGVFDPDGRGIGGPPGDAGQSLPRYDVDVRDGLLFLRVNVDSLADGERATGEIIEPQRSRPGHDPCLGPCEPGCGGRKA